MCKRFCLFCFLFSAFSINLLAIHSQNDIHSINEKLFEVLLYYSEDYNYDINHLMEIIDTERGYSMIWIIRIRQIQNGNLVFIGDVFPICQKDF